MRESIGTSNILNIIIVFIVTVFAAIAGIISYNKAYKVSTRIGDAIERAEGYNSVSKTEISRVLGNLGYLKGKPSCVGNTDGLYQYCVSDPIPSGGKYYQYDVITYMYFNFPLINSFRVPIKTTTSRIYRFGN